MVLILWSSNILTFIGRFSTIICWWHDCKPKKTCHEYSWDGLSMDSWIPEKRGFVPPSEDDQVSFALAWGWDHEKDCCQPSGWAHGIGDQSEDHRRPVHPLGVVWADGRLCLTYRRVGRGEILSCRLWVVGGCFFFFCVPKLMSWSTLLGGVSA